MGLSDAIALFFSLRLEDFCPISYRTLGCVYLENKLIFSDLYMRQNLTCHFPLS